MKPSSQLLPKLAAPIASAIVVVLDTRGGGAVALAAERPALVVVISVDQMRADYLDRFRPWFGDDGFNRFLKTGASFPNAAYRNAATYTAPDHASIGTGLDPGHHGIIGNSWFDVKLKSPVYCVEDPGEWVVGAAGAGKTPRDPPASPTRLTTVSERRRGARLAGVVKREKVGGGFPSNVADAAQAAGAPGAAGDATVRAGAPAKWAALGDRLKETFPASRVVGIALKDRAAVLMSGREADAVYWFMDDLERFVTSSYYPSASLPALLAFDERLPAYFARPDCTRWDPLQDKGAPRIPDVDLARLTFDPPDLWPFKGPRDGMEPGFPHNLLTARAKVSSPCGDRLILDLARYVIRQMDLGRNPAGAPDLLFIGMSSTDYSGHMFGPDSKEIADAIVRLDGTLASFLELLDCAAGRDRALVWLTSDHCVAPIPEVELARPGRTAQGGAGLDGHAIGAGRVDFYLRGVEPTAAVRDAPPERLRIERALAAAHGDALREDLLNRQEGLIVWFDEPCLYVNRDVVRRRLAARKGADGGEDGAPPTEERVAAEVKAVSVELRDLVRKVPGVEKAWTHDEIERAARALQVGESGQESPSAAASASPTSEKRLLDALARSFESDRTGDVCAILKPGWIWMSEGKGTSHGQPYDYDQRVPLLAWGAGVRAGSYDLSTSPLAIARTTAEIFGLPGVGEDDIAPLEPVVTGYTAAASRSSGSNPKTRRKHPAKVLEQR